jgi:membrane protein DedA with SNARE-associated domain
MHFFVAFKQASMVAATQMPLPWFVFVGSFFEEVISPAAAVLVMGTAGSLAFTQGHTLAYVPLLAALASLGRTLGAWMYYVLGDKFEDLLIGKVSKFIGMKHEDIEAIGKRFTGHHWKDGGALFLMRATPFFPTTIVSVVAGIIKMDLRTFLMATYFGHIIKDFFFIYAGYMGFQTVRNLFKTLAPFRYGVPLIVIGILVTIVALWYFRYGPGEKKDTDKPVIGS